MWLFVHTGIIEGMCAGTVFGYMYVHMSMHASSLWPAKGATGDKGGRSHPLVVDSEVVIEANDALCLAQKAAVGGLRPPVQQVS